MRLLYTFRFQQMGETWLGAVVGQNAHLFNGVLQLNEVGHFIVFELAKMASVTDKGGSAELTELELISCLATSLTKEYAVDEATAQSAVRQVIDYLKSEQVIE